MSAIHEPAGLNPPNSNNNINDIDYDKQPTYNNHIIQQSPPARDHRQSSMPIPDVNSSIFYKFKYWVQDRDVHVWIMSLGFMLLFTSYPIQGVQTIRYPATGAYILIVLYSGYFATSMWATFFLDWWGLEFCLPWYVNIYYIVYCVYRTEIYNN